MLVLALLRPGPLGWADLENGLFQSNYGYSKNASNTGTGSMPFVTALLKNNGQDHFALKYGNAQSGGLTTTYSGGEPTTSGYSPMHQEGAIVLGTGGDNSNGSIGSFFEGVMTFGMPTDAADDSVQANIVSVGYGGATGSTGSLTAGSEISLRATTSCCTTDYIRHQNNAAVISAITSSSSTLNKATPPGSSAGASPTAPATPRVTELPGDFLRRFDCRSTDNPWSAPRSSDRTPRSAPGPARAGRDLVRFVQLPDKEYLRHYNYNVYIASDGGSNTFDSATSWTDDVSWAVTAPWAP